jgi:hypothetical protein
MLYGCVPTCHARYELLGDVVSAHKAPNLVNHLWRDYSEGDDEDTFNYRKLHML